jgi:hypothetical protein
MDISNGLNAKILSLFGPDGAEMARVLTELSKNTQLRQYTATFSSLTNATAATFFAREGQFLRISGQVKWTGAGGAGNFTVALPGAVAGSPIIDTAFLPGGTGTANGTVSMCGSLGYWFDNGNGWLFVAPIFATTTTVGFACNTQVITGDLFANGDMLNFEIKVPIVGWT